MSENQVMDQEVLEMDQKVLESNQTQLKIPLAPVVYSSLLSKLRQNNGMVVSVQDNNQDTNQDTNQNNNLQEQHGNDKNKRGFKPRQNGQKPQPKKNGQQTQQGFQRNYKNNNQPRQPRLSPEDYLDELKNCQKLFFVHLAEYLKEEFIVKSKPEDDKKKEIKIIKKTNLSRIQGGLGVNVMRIFLDKNENSEQKYITGLGYLDNLVSNRQMNFVETLTNYMNKYGISTSFRGKNNIMIHSPYILV